MQLACPQSKVLIKRDVSSGKGHTISAFTVLWPVSQVSGLISHRRHHLVIIQ